MKRNSISMVVIVCVAIMAMPLLVLGQDVPYRTGFEAPTFTAGTLHNQDGWLVNEGTASVQSAKRHSGTQAVQVDPDSTIVRALDGTGITSVWAQGYYSGAGISETDLAHIFDPYFTTKASGTGLVLAIAHKILEGHGGKIKVDSRPGSGTTVTLILPSGKSEADES